MQRIIWAKSRKDWIRWLEYCHQECVAKKERERERCLNLTMCPSCIGALLMYRKDNVQHISKICNGAVVRYHASAAASFKRKDQRVIQCQYRLCTAGTGLKYAKVQLCVCIYIYMYFFCWSLPLRSSSSPNKSRHDSLQVISCPTTELSANGAWFNSGNNNSPKKRLLPRQPHDTLSLGPTPCLFWGGEFSAYQVTPPTRSSKIHLMGGNS